MSSQRHRLDNYNTTSAGEVHAQGVVAASVTAQVDPSALNVLIPKAGPPEGGFTVPIGPDGGPLKGSAMSGAIPEGLEPGPPPPDPQPGMEPTITGLDPDTAAIGDADLTLTVVGTNFTETSVIIFNNGAEYTSFVSDVAITTLVKPSLVSLPVTVPVQVQQGSYVTAPADFTFTAAAPAGLSLTSISPPSGLENTPVTITVTGTGFVDGMYVAVDINVLATTFVSATSLTADVPGDFAAWTYPVTVSDGVQTSNVVDWEVVAAVGTRSFPIGPLTISHIEDHADGLAVMVAGDVQVGDSVLVEASGNTSVNGTYNVLAVDNGVVVIDSSYELTTPIDAKGRLTVTN